MSNTIENLAAIAARHLKFNNGVAEIDSAKYTEEAFATLGTTSQEVRKAYENTSSLVNALAKAFVDGSMEAMTNDKKLDKTSIECKIGHEKVSQTLARSAEVRNPSNGETSTVKGALSVRRTIANGGSELKTIKEHAREIGMKRL